MLKRSESVSDEPADGAMGIGKKLKSNALWRDQFDEGESPHSVLIKFVVITFEAM